MKDCPFRIGKKYFIRTLTYHMLGEVKEIKGNFLVLKKASWIADSGRFSNFINGEISSNLEIEPVEETIINFTNIVDAFEWKHDLFRDQK